MGKGLCFVDMNSETNNPHKGALCILVPDDWDFISGEYESSDENVGSGTLELDPNPDSPVYGNVDTLIPPPADMKWIKLLSDNGYLHDADITHIVTVNLSVGQKSGAFPIGYLVTVNTIDMFKFINDVDHDTLLAGVDTSMNHMVTVTGTNIDQDNIVA